MTEEIAETGAETSKAKHETEKQSPTQASDSAETPESTSEAPPPPVPEPLTPERAAAENWRNDWFITAAVLVTAFLLGSFKIADPDLWIHLKSGWQIDQQGVPNVDSFAYSTQDQKWVNLNWPYDWGLYQIEVIESRMRVNRLVQEYRQLLSDAQQPKLDSQGRETGKRLPNETVQELEASITVLADTAKTTDTYQMRTAAEHTAEMVKRAGLAEPQLLYPALAAYNSPAGEALIQFAAAVVIKSILLVALAAILLCVRHPGPTSWWTSAVTVIALVGMSDRFTLSPSVFSLLGVAVVLWILHAYQTGRTWAAWLLIPVEFLWVNVDAAFALGFVLVAIVLGCQIVGRAVRRASGQEKEPPTTVLAGAFVLALVVTFANPFSFGAWSVPYEWTQFMLGRASYVAATAASMFGGTGAWVKEAQLSGREILSVSPDLVAPIGRYARLLGSFAIAPMAAVLVILLSFLSFGLNRKRFRVSRLLIVLLCVGMFVFAERYVAFAVLVAGVVLALNGQEWFLDRFGTETRIARGWWAWSQAGRATTVLGIVAIAIALITGWFSPMSGGDFGYGIHWVVFDLEPGKLLRQANLKGKVLNTVPVQGNLLIWSNFPATQVYLDSRECLHQSHLQEFEKIKLALLNDDPDLLPEFLDRYGISHIILNITRFADSVRFPRTLARMIKDSKWRLVQLSSNSAVFGRVDLPDGHPLAEDAEWIEKNSFDPARMAYAQDADPLPEPPGPVTPPNWVDIIWRRRRAVTPQAVAASHYLSNAMLKGPPSAAEAASMGPVFIVPTANCFLAIREARRGLAKEARISPIGYSVLSDAYFYLYNTESMVAPIPDVHDMRLYQLVTALNQWVAANPNDPLGQLQLMLRYRSLRYIDLADRHLDALLKLWNQLPDDTTIEDLIFDGGQRLSLDKEKLQGESRKLKDELARVDYDMEQAGAQLTNPVTKANYLAMRGCPARAIEQLNEAIAFGAPNDLSPLLAQLYLHIGQPGDSQRGADQQMINMQQSGGMRPGEKDELWALIKLMQGDYDRARGLMEAAVAETRINLAKEALITMTSDLRNGTVMHAAFGPVDSIEAVDRLVRMEHQLGMIHLEAGEPGEAAKHFKQSLAIRPDNAYRRISGFYLEKITGEKLEPLPEQGEDEESGSGMPGNTPPLPPAEVPPKPDDNPND